MRILFCCVIAIVATPHVQGQSEPARIRVVKSWEDLHAIPPIDLGDGVKIRLGLEADKIPQWSGALLYCLAEGYAPPTGGSGKAPFGPVHAEFSYAREKTIADEMRWSSNGKEPKGTYLFVRGLPIDRVGKYEIRVTDRKGKLVAAGTVEGTNDAFHPWMPWLEGLDESKAPWKGIALPNVDRIGPLAFLEEGKPRKGELPRMLPNNDKPKMTIAMDGKEIVIRADSPFTTSRPDYHFLARWWVNGKPFVPKQTDQFLSFAGYGRVSEDKELRLEYEFRPERLGAKPGDKIGLQLMHSEGAWNWCDGTSLTIKAGGQHRDEQVVRVSNQIEFKAAK